MPRAAPLAFSTSMSRADALTLFRFLLEATNLPEPVTALQEIAPKPANISATSKTFGKRCFTELTVTAAGTAPARPQMRS